jgi:ABC-type antimicrobial peptide transport system permease subunit
VLHSRTLTTQLNAGIARERVMAWLSTSFAVIAVGVAMSGLFGLLSYAVSRRTREIGIRVALGAQPWFIAGQIIREGLTLCMLGLIIGVPSALLAGRFAEALLFGVSGHDSTSLVAAIGLFVTVGALAGVLPARRAARVDPLAAIRSE